MQNARSTAAISRASEGYHFSHDALVTCKLPIHINFSFDFLGLDKVYFKNYFANELI